MPKEGENGDSAFGSLPLGATRTLSIYEFERTLRAEEAMARLSMEGGEGAGERAAARMAVGSDGVAGPKVSARRHTSCPSNLDLDPGTFYVC